jgi:hypothetical protein
MTDGRTESYAVEVYSMDKNHSVAARAVEDIPASRPGPISIIAMIIVFGIILTVDNWSLIKRLIS